MSRPAVTTRAGEYRRTEQTLTIDGLRLKVSFAGPAGEVPLVLISGIGAPLELWDPFRKALGMETVAVDAPGVGGSDTMRFPRTMWGIAGLVNKLLDKMGYGVVDVLGLSWGGGVAQHLALRRRDRVRKLVLASTGFGLWSIPGDIRAVGQLLTPARYFSQDNFLRVAPAMYGGETRRHPELLASQAAVRSSHRPSAVGYAHQLAAAWTWVALPFLPFIRCETLVLSGDDDPIVHVATARIMAAALPHGHLHIAHDGGHLYMVDQADDAARVVGDFLATKR